MTTAQIRASEELQRVKSFNDNIEPDRVTEFLEFHGVDHKGMEEEADRYKWVMDHCPFNEDHRAKDAAVFLYKEKGNLGFHCFHESCGENTWKQFRQQVESVSGKKFAFNDEVIEGRIIIGPQLSEENTQLRADMAALEVAPEFPLVSLEESWIGELTQELTRGTAIPPSSRLQFLERFCRRVGGRADWLQELSDFAHTVLPHACGRESDRKD